MERKLFVGDVVKIKTKCLLLGNADGTLGVVYEEYDLGTGPGASVIFPNGEYDGFSIDEQDLMIDKVGHDGDCADYIFDNVIALSRDFRNGFFSKALSGDYSPETRIEAARRTVG